MMNKSEFIKIAKQILHPHKQVRSPQIMHPQREWIIGLAVVVIILSAGAIWSAQTYLLYREVVISENDTTTENDTTVYRETLVKSAIDSFVQREVVFNSLLKKYSVEQPQHFEMASTTPIGEVSLEESPAKEDSGSGSTTSLASSDSKVQTESIEEGVSGGNIGVVLQEE